MMVERPRLHWLGFSPQRAVLLFIVMAVVILGVYQILSTENARKSSRPAVAGWDEIEECGSLTSFDGTKTIDFEQAHKIILTERSSDEDEDDKSERKITGTWSFDAVKERYTVYFKDAARDYTLVKPEDSSVCIFAPGDVGAVDLRESWFGRTEEE